MTESELSFSDVTTGNVSTTAHGLAPKAPNDATKFLDGTGAYSVPAGGSPSGAAGGDLTGTYPNPTLGTSGVTAATYGDSTHVPQIAVDAKGRITSASNVAISGGGGGAWTLIADQLLSGTQASFDTNTILGGNIPSSYKHIFIEAKLRSTDAGVAVGCAIRFNNDSGTNYHYQQLFGHNATASATSGVSQTSLDPAAGTCAAGGSISNGFSILTMDLSDYAGTTGYKPVAGTFLGMNATDMYSLLFGGHWLNTAAINRVFVGPSAGSWAIGSRFSIWGIS